MIGPSENLKQEKKNEAIYSLSDRPSWDEYFMYLCYSIAARSDDLYVKCGSIIVSEQSKHIVGTGYNNTIAGMDLKFVKPDDREYRRKFMKHAEYNAMKNCYVNPQNYTTAFTIYISGEPCDECLSDIIQFGIKRIVYVGNSFISNVHYDMEQREPLLEIMSRKYIDYVHFQRDNRWVQKGLKSLENF